MSTLTNIISYLTAVDLPVPVFFGFSQHDRPFVSIMDFSQVPTYQIPGVAYRTSTFKVSVLAQHVDDGEALADQVNALIELQQVTDLTMSCFQESRTVLVTEGWAYHCVFSYTLMENVA